MLWGCRSLLGMPGAEGALIGIWMLLGAGPQGPRWPLPTRAAGGWVLVLDRCNGGGGFSVGLGQVCLSRSGADAQAHGGLSQGAPHQPGWRSRRTGTLGLGGLIEGCARCVVSFLHGESSCNCPSRSSRLHCGSFPISRHSTSFSKLSSQAELAGAELLQVEAAQFCRPRLEEVSVHILQAPKPQGPSPGGEEDVSLMCDPSLGPLPA